MTINVYGKPGCVQCTATTRRLDKLHIVYDYTDVTENPQALARVRELGYQQVPVVETETQHWSGYRPDRIMGLIQPKEAA
jgi:glutaredoxin-like protein NrdH